MNTPARIAYCLIVALFTAFPCRGSLIVNWLDDPIVLQSIGSVQTPLDMNSDGLIDFTFGSDLSFVGVHPEAANQYLVYSSPPPNIGGPVEPLPARFEIGPNSNDGELEWYGSTGYSTLIQCLSGSGGYTCAGRFPGHHAYMGVEFSIEGATHYGWINVSVADYGPYAEIHGWAYESTPGMGLIAGAIPEPSTLLLLLVGAASLILRKGGIR